MKPIILIKNAVYILAAVTLVFVSCKKSTTKPTPPASTITDGRYTIIKDEGSDNGDTNYYTRTLTDCENNTVFVFDGNYVSIITCDPNNSTLATYTYDNSTHILTLTDPHRNTTSTVKIENLTATGLIWNAIATGQDNSRLTLKLVQ